MGREDCTNTTCNWREKQNFWYNAIEICNYFIISGRIQGRCYPLCLLSPTQEFVRANGAEWSGFVAGIISQDFQALERKASSLPGFAKSYWSRGFASPEIAKQNRKPTVASARRVQFNGWKVMGLIYFLSAIAKKAMESGVDGRDGPPGRPNDGERISSRYRG